MGRCISANTCRSVLYRLDCKCATRHGRIITGRNKHASVYATGVAQICGVLQCEGHETNNRHNMAACIRALAVVRYLAFVVGAKASKHTTD